MNDAAKFYVKLIGFTLVFAAPFVAAFFNIAAR